MPQSVVVLTGAGMGAELRLRTDRCGRRVVGGPPGRAGGDPGCIRPSGSR